MPRSPTLFTIILEYSPGKNVDLVFFVCLFLLLFVVFLLALCQFKTEYSTIKKETEDFSYCCL